MTPEQLFEENIKLATHVAMRFTAIGEYDEVMQLARIGLFKACQRFDPSYGYRFSTYAVPTIRNEIIRGHFEVRDIIKIPRLIKEDRVKVNRFLEQTEDINELSELTGVPPHRVIDVFDSFRHGVDSFSQFMVRGEDITLEDMIGAEQEMDLPVQITDFISTLEGRDKLVIDMALQEKPQTEIGQALGISQVHVSRILKKIRNRYEQFTSLEGEPV